MTGDIPQWYRVVKAARYLRVAPWELAEAPVYWMNAAESAQEVDAHMDKIESAKQARTR